MTDWNVLLAQPDGPEGRYRQVLDDVRERAAHTGTSVGERILARADEPLAAVAVLAGPARAREFAQAAQPVVTRMGQRLAVAPLNIDPLSVLMLLSISAISETIGAPLTVPRFDLDRKLEDLLANRLLSPGDRITLALLLVWLDRVDDVARMFGKGAADSTALVKVLAFAVKSKSGDDAVDVAWNAFVHGFPTALSAELAEWRHLLLAARIVFAKLGGVASGDVAETLHRQVLAIAGGASKPNQH